MSDKFDANTGKDLNIPGREFPQFLYRYRSNESQFLEEEIKKLSEREIFLGDAHGMNDEFEARPILVPSKLAELRREVRRVGDGRYRRMRKADIIAHGRPGLFILPEVEKSWGDASAMVRLDYRAISRARSIPDLFNIKLACFSEDGFSAAMWDPYANSYEGIVIEYRVRHKNASADHYQLPLPVEYITGAPRITYLEMFKAINFEIFQDEAVMDKVVRQATMYKRESWSSEKEWRLTRPPEGNGGYTPFYNLIPNRLILGLRSSLETEQLVRSLAPDLKLARSKIDSRIQEFVYEDIS